MLQTVFYLGAWRKHSNQIEFSSSTEFKKKSKKCDKKCNWWVSEATFSSKWHNNLILQNKVVKTFVLVYIPEGSGFVVVCVVGGAVVDLSKKMN